ncbi:MAG: hypothetical protein KGL46_09865 [Hyphomicrobiales bacterium]|nr:hypothetical protein [Hyphomicrobiales bacterium]
MIFTRTSPPDGARAAFEAARRRSARLDAGTPLAFGLDGLGRLPVFVNLRCYFLAERYSPPEANAAVANVISTVVLIGALALAAALWRAWAAVPARLPLPDPHNPFFMLTAASGAAWAITGLVLALLSRRGALNSISAAICDLRLARPCWSDRRLVRAVLGRGSGERARRHDFIAGVHQFGRLPIAGGGIRARRGAGAAALAGARLAGRSPRVLSAFAARSSAAYRTVSVIVKNRHYFIIGP